MSTMWDRFDRDNIPLYLIDYVNGWLKENSIETLDDFNESFQSDDFQESLQELAEEVVSAVIAMKGEANE